MTEPGGCLLWVEHNPTDSRIELNSPGLKSDAWQIIQGLSDGPRALRKFRFGIPLLECIFPRNLWNGLDADEYDQ